MCGLGKGVSVMAEPVSPLRLFLAALSMRSLISTTGMKHDFTLTGLSQSQCMHKAHTLLSIFHNLTINPKAGPQK